MIDVREYESLAREAGVYKDIELDILAETLAAWRERHGEPYTLLELRDGKPVAGFALVCREASTDHSFELRAICLGASYLGKGVAERLLSMVEEEVLSAGADAIVRIEISSTKEAALGPGLFASSGYSVIGHIPDFYSAGDDYFMYAKHLSRRAEGGAAEREGRS